MQGQRCFFPEMTVQKLVVEQAVKLSEGKLAEVADWLEKLGCGVEKEYETINQGLFGDERKLVQVNVDGLSGTGTGFAAGLDRRSAFVILGFALFGMQWPFVIGPGLEEVDKERG